MLVTLFKAHRPIPEAQVKAFVRAVADGMPDRLPGAEPVCGAAFAQLAPDGRPTRIASMDINGRDFCNDLLVITRREKAVMGQDLTVWMVDNVLDVLVDLRHDGTLELVVSTAASDYLGYRCMGTWTRVLTLDDGRLVDRSADFKGFYRTELDRIVKKLPSVRAGDPDEDQSDRLGDAACLQMEADRIRRFLGLSRDAGQATAIRWLNSKDESLRSKGMTVLTDIGDPQSIAIAQRTALDWIRTNDAPTRVGAELWLMLHGDRHGIATYQSLALSWVRGADNDLRYEGLRSLVEIGRRLSLDQSAIDLLRTLAQDSDENIASQAGMASNEAGVPKH